MRQLLILGLLLASMGVAFGQPRDQFMNASITGRGGEGKCTIEVNVDDTAIVEISGDRGRLITVNGQPAQWRRFECNQRMPRMPEGFRFAGVDGRGRQQLLKDPGSNRGLAVIRIEDPQGGREGYTFDILWRGGADYPGPRSGRDRDDDRRDNRGEYRGDNRGDRDRRDQEAFVVTCSSNDGNRHYCEVDTRQGVRMLRQISGSECREGRTWGYDRRGIWVDRGCRADFEVRR